MDNFKTPSFLNTFAEPYSQNYAMRKYSIIVPVYNRPDEVDELLQSLVNQSYTDFEVIIIEDGSAIKCQDITEKYSEKLIKIKR